MNKYQEALETLAGIAYNHMDYMEYEEQDVDILREKVDMCIRSIEELYAKETPMKPINKDITYLTTDGQFTLVVGHCHKCGYEDLNELNNYCNNCGQRIYWRDE